MKIFYKVYINLKFNFYKKIYIFWINYYFPSVKTYDMTFVFK